MKLSLNIQARQGSLGFAALAFRLVRRPGDFDEMPAAVFAALAKTMGRRIVVRLPKRSRGTVRRGEK